jgi:glycerol dehydrogenase-like iron-containing ADH family enzyme
MNALIVAGTSMAICGNSRPASGSEHHQSHFLEMDFVRRGEKIPMHGIKVAIGTLVSITLYNFIKDNNLQHITQNKYDALVSITYNLGDGWSKEMNGNLRKAVVSGDNGSIFAYSLIL